MREVAACTALGHAAIGSADAFADGEHLAFAVPEREGVTLEVVLERQAVSGEALALPAVCHIGRAVASALSAAHSAALDDDLVTVCHGFLAPSWVSVAWDGTVGLDALGLAAVADAAGLRVPSKFDAPERRRGGKPNSRGDIYSLGVLVWALLTGEEPSDEPLVAALPSTVPDAIRQVLERALEPTLAKRKLTAAEFEIAFEAAAGGDGQTVLASSLVKLRKGTNVLGTFRRPAAFAPPTASTSSAPPGSPPPPRALAPSGTLLSAPPLGARPGALPPRPAGLPGGAPAPGGRALPPRTMLGLAAPKSAEPVPTNEIPSPALDAVSPSEGAPPLESVAASPAPARASSPRASGSFEDEPPPPSIRPRLPSISQGRRVTKSAFQIEDEIPWAEGKTDDIARAVDAALLDDLVAPSGQRAPEPPPPSTPAPGPPPPPPSAGSTRPSPSSDPAPPSVDSLRLDDSAPSSVRASPAIGELASASTSVPVAAVERPAGTAAAPQPTFQVVADEGKPLALWKALLLALGAAGVVFAGGVGWMMRQQHLPPPSEPADAATASAVASASSSAAVTATASADASAAVTATASADASADASAAVTATASADASAAPSADASAAVTATASADASAAPAAGAPSIDPATLPPNQALLVVHFPSAPDGTVFHFVTPLGKVEQTLTVACDRPLFLRVADKVVSGGPGNWLTGGNPRSVNCRQLNEVTLSPGR
ncbi:MAG: hypothetical protein FJ096_18020 [Deltaproteobacteria bacterium]|nr:hypothetical protein [Deltaproteobacteria bacterium]